MPVFLSYFYLFNDIKTHNTVSSDSFVCRVIRLARRNVFIFYLKTILWHVCALSRKQLTSGNIHVCTRSQSRPSYVNILTEIQSFEVKCIERLSITFQIKPKKCKRLFVCPVDCMNVRLSIRAGAFIKWWRQNQFDCFFFISFSVEFRARFFYFFFLLFRLHFLHILLRFCFVRNICLHYTFSLCIFSTLLSLLSPSMPLFLASSFSPIIILRLDSFLFFVVQCHLKMFSSWSYRKFDSRSHNLLIFYSFFSLFFSHPPVPLVYLIVVRFFHSRNWTFLMFRNKKCPESV